MIGAGGPEEGEHIQSPETERQLYDFFHHLLLQMPNGADTAAAAFADWRGWPEGMLIALDNSGAWVGLTALKKTDDHCHVAFTGVVAEHRGQGVALALKLAAIDLMRQAGVREVTTVNHAARIRTSGTKKGRGRPACSSRGRRRGTA